MRRITEFEAKLASERRLREAAEKAMKTYKAKAEAEKKAMATLRAQLESHFTQLRRWEKYVNRDGSGML